MPRILFATLFCFASLCVHAGDDDRASKQLADAAIDAMKRTPGELLRSMADLSDSVAGVTGPTPMAIAPSNASPREWIEPKSHAECLAENQGQA